MIRSIARSTVLLFSLLLASTSAWTASVASPRTPLTMMPAVEAPPRERVDRKQRTARPANDEADEDYDWRREGPLEYLEDMEVSREDDDPFHILLLGATFEKPKITVNYVSGSLEYVLDMPPLEALELSNFAQEHGMSCLGTWKREECLALGKQLQVRDIVCRVVPYCEGGQRGWQAKDAGGGASKSGNFEGFN